ncbi:uncharacterized protein LOC123720808 [Pieris brassicae]|uniref:uncharacterized protein LOC123720808 n=1 Tax=Pieris brassicae TaxID=7116 RepID=UPI001E65FB96|nr:uncharacterized protein LOC123720808 [Pieris brassicae]
MGCTRGLCTSQSVFIFINIAFAMYSGALLSTAARLAWDPSTYTWFRFLCAAQYRVSLAYVLAAGLWLAALVYLAVAAGAAAAAARRPAAALHTYVAGVCALALSEVAYGAWLVASLAAWWRAAPEAELARKGIDLLHDIKPALLAVERYRDVAQPLYNMIEEVEARAPNNAVIVIVFAVLAVVLQVAAVVVARRLARGGVTAGRRCEPGEVGEVDSDSEALEKSAPPSAPPASSPPPPGWHKSANLRMYTILDKIF